MIHDPRNMTHTLSQFIVAEKNSGARLDIFLSSQLKETRSYAQKLIKHGKILMNGVEISKAGERLEAGDVVTLDETETHAGSLDTGALLVVDQDIKIIAETPGYIIIDKPSGVIVHPIRNVIKKIELKKSPTIAGWILRHYPKLWGVGEYANRPGIVHRLDKEASGLMVIAKNHKMFLHLKKQFQDRTIEKHYWALAYGAIDPDHHVIQFPIDRSKEGRMVARPHIEKITLKNVKDVQEGRDATTEFWVEKRFRNYTFVNVRLHTGRTHQIRVHFFAYNHPLVGDPLYFHKKRQTKHGMSLPRLFLHAYRLCFDDVQKERHCFESKLPEELKSFLSTLH